VKSPDQVTDDVARRLDRTWHTHLEPGVDPAWPHTFPLSAPTKDELERNFERYRTNIFALRAWAARHGLALTDARGGCWARPSPSLRT
jgi:Uncharacterized protein conserved in bacteria N-term (DUF3322)